MYLLMRMTIADQARRAVTRAIAGNRCTPCELTDVCADLLEGDDLRVHDQVVLLRNVGELLHGAIAGSGTHRFDAVQGAVCGSIIGAVRGGTHPAAAAIVAVETAALESHDIGDPGILMVAVTSAALALDQVSPAAVEPLHQWINERLPMVGCCMETRTHTGQNVDSSPTLN